MTRQEFGQRLATARESLGLTQRDVAALLAMPQPRWAEYERGVRAPSIERLTVIVDVLGLDPALLFPAWFDAR